MIRHWFAAIVRFAVSLGPELVWADAVGPYVDSPYIRDRRPDPEITEDEEARLQAMLMSMAFM
jgi:hypothetical protein